MKVPQCWFVTVCLIAENGRWSPILRRSPSGSVFSQAMAIVQQQEKSWELRTTTSLTHLWRRHGKSADDHR
jgi:hypothetical protein